MYFYVIYFYYCETMDNDELRDQIETLRNEMRVLGNSFASLRMDDIRTVLGEQARTFQRERIERFFEQRQKEGLAGPTDLRCKIDLEQFIELNIFTFKQRGRTEAIRELDDHVRDEHPALSDDYPPECVKFAEEVFDQLREYYNMPEKMLHPTMLGIDVTSRPRPRKISSKDVEDALAPLANSWRIDLLAALSDEEFGLAELGRKIGLKKGHAQFHIKALLASGYIRYDRKSRLYSLTEKGREAYDGANAFVQRLASV